MDYEKKYKQLHTLISDLYPFMSEYCKEKVEGFFPELKESEDERIRKEIIEYLEERQIIEKLTETKVKKNWIAWLEKQGEQNPAWSEEDEKMYAAAAFAFAGFMNNEDKLDWLKSLKDRVQPQWKPTDEQMNCFKQAIDLFKMKVNDDLVLRYLNSLYENLLKL